MFSRVESKSVRRKGETKCVSLGRKCSSVFCGSSKGPFWAIILFGLYPYVNGVRDEALGIRCTYSDCKIMLH